NGEIVTAPYTLPYTNDGLTGTLNDPYVIQLDPKYGGLESIAVEQIAIYPNPVKSELFITSALPIKRVEITSVTGTVLQIEDNFNEKLSVASLPAGVYMVKIHTDNGVAIRKVVKE
ncbi:MAG: T9SS type A sorting domain-containing protein, partial [Candidatus Symbiothrix sp.]|nr:T9SS type A sorting domain-containing protein [Candidatus Symbiothrix sp.]